MKARQIGASHTYAAASVLWAALAGETTTVISVGEREAKEVLVKAGQHARLLTELGSKLAGSTPTATELRFTHGGRVIALPQTSAGRSYSGNVVLDEIAYYERPEEVWDGASAVTMHGGKLRGLSTPNGVGNLFDKLRRNPLVPNDDGTPSERRVFDKLHLVTIDEARRDGLRVTEAECWKMARGDARVYDQLFRGSFLDNEAQYIPGGLITACTVDDAYCYEGECYAGLDIGKTADLTVLVVIKRDATGLLWVQHVETRKRTASEDLDALARLAIHDFKCRRLCVDATGMGSFPAEDLQKRFGRFKVEPFAFTSQSKEDLATTMYQAFADHRLRLPRKEDKLREDVCAIRRIVTSAGNIRYDAPHTDDGHADRAWALALAIHGCSGPDRRRNVIADE